MKQMLLCQGGNRNERVTVGILLLFDSVYLCNSINIASLHSRTVTLCYSINVELYSRCMLLL